MTPPVWSLFMTSEPHRLENTTAFVSEQPNNNDAVFLNVFQTLVKCATYHWISSLFLGQMTFHIPVNLLIKRHTAAKLEAELPAPL